MISTERFSIGKNYTSNPYKSISVSGKTPEECYTIVQLFANKNENRGFNSVSEIWRPTAFGYDLIVIYYIGYWDDSPNM